MHLLYEEDGEIKAGTVHTSTAASHQIDTPHGRRVKIKIAQVVLEFSAPSPAELLAAAHAFASELDIDFLWQCAGKAEFGFMAFAQEYVGRAPTATEAAGILCRLQAAPIYFYRRGKGRFQAAPEDTLKAALAGLEKKRRQAERAAAWTDALVRGEFPEALRPLRDVLLYKPDRNQNETKAVEAACKQTSLSVARLFERAGALPSSHDYHLNRFLFEFFPAGTGFTNTELPTMQAELPLAEALAYSLDDVGTTEIDDAFSVRRTSEDEWRIGVHIAAPGLGILPGSAMDAIARERLSTVYMPGNKITMLPDRVVQQYSLDEGTERPVVSVYFNIAAEDFSVRGHHSRVERIRIARNLRHADYDVLNTALPEGAPITLEYATELNTLWKFALAREAVRGKPSVASGVLDYNIEINDEQVSIVQRRRGAPLDKLVSELMILANATWGGLLAERDIAALYRVQTSGKVRMSVHAEMHEGLGVSCYAWMSSPLRRYVDLVNQWQLIAALNGNKPPFTRQSDTLLAAMRAFEVVYARYDEHQREMERYWCLRWLQQEHIAQIHGTVVREQLVRLDGLPMLQRVASLPELSSGARVVLEVGAIDLLEKTVLLTWRETLPSPAAAEPT